MTDVVNIGFKKLISGVVWGMILAALMIALTTITVEIIVLTFHWKYSITIWIYRIMAGMAGLLFLCGFSYGASKYKEFWR